MSATTMMADEFLLSAENPLATVHQRDLEDLALRLLDGPVLTRAKAGVKLLWEQVSAYSTRDQMDRFDNFIDEHMYHFTARAVNSDANYPRVFRFMAPPHRWFGRDVPGSRWTGDSPDFIYRLVPVEHGARYEIRGRTTCQTPPMVAYQLLEMRSAPTPHDLLDSLDMEVARDGSFVITIDSEPANGRPNHLQTRPGSDHILIRDSVWDWVGQTPNDLRVHRLDPPGRDPLSEEEIERRAAQAALDGIYYSYYTTRNAGAHPPNVLRPPVSSAAFGGMPTQWSSKAQLDLAEDEALVVTANVAGALFRNIQLCDLFQLSLDYWARTSSLNMFEMAADESGDFTYVVAHRDPGVHNWLDTGGLRRTLFGQRWQAIPKDHSGETPRMSTRVVKFANLDRELPAGVRRIDADGRKRQIEQRSAGYARRFVDD